MSTPDQTAAEAAAFRALVAHLQARTDVQNIDLMNLAGFCRNCLSNWLVAADHDLGGSLTESDAREHVYGMPYADWKAKHQRPATPDQLRQFEQSRPLHATHPKLG